jgi:hypothetical protein
MRIKIQLFFITMPIRIQGAKADQRGFGSGSCKNVIIFYMKIQCCGSEMFIPDPGS